MMNAPGKSKRRRRFQFSLKTVFVAMTIVALGLGMALYKARRLRRAVGAMTAAGGAVHFRPQMKNAKAPPPAPAWLRRLRGDELLMTPVCVHIRGPDVTDEFIAKNLSSMTSLEELDIHGANVTDAALAHITSMRHLHSLTLDCPRITDV